MRNPLLQVTITLSNDSQILNLDEVSLTNALQGKVWQRPMLSSHSNARRTSVSVFLLEDVQDEEMVLLDKEARYVVYIVEDNDTDACIL